MDSIKIFKYVIAMNVAIVLLFVVFLFGMKLYQAETTGLKVVDTSIEYNQINSLEIDFKEDLLNEKQELMQVINNTEGKDVCDELNDFNLMSLCKKSVEVRIVYSGKGIAECQKLETKNEIKACELKIKYIEFLKEKENLEYLNFDNRQDEDFLIKEFIKSLK